MRVLTDASYNVWFGKTWLFSNVELRKSEQNQKVKEVNGKFESLDWTAWTFPRPLERVQTSFPLKHLGQSSNCNTAKKDYFLVKGKYTKLGL